MRIQDRNQIIAGLYIVAAVAVAAMMLSCGFTVLQGSEGASDAQRGAVSSGADVSGTDGDIIWSITGDTATFIKDPDADNGRMDDYLGSWNPPWMRSSAWKNVRHVVIGQGVENIGDDTFSNSTRIKTVDMSSADSLTTIGYGAFRNCSSLTTVLMPSSLTVIDELAFKDCSSLMCVDLGGTSVTEIKDDAFLCCSSLTNISLPSSVRTIGNYAFSECSALRFVVMPMSGLTVGDGLFSYCSYLSDVWFIGDTFDIKCNDWDFEIGDAFSTGGNPSVNCNIHSRYNAADGVFDECMYREGTVFVYAEIPEERYTMPNVSYTWLNYDDTVLQVNMNSPGFMSVSYTSPTPEHKDGMTFCGWEDVKDEGGIVILRAMFQYGWLDDIGGNSEDESPSSDGLMGIVKEAILYLRDLIMDFLRGLHLVSFTTS